MPTSTSGTWYMGAVGLFVYCMATFYYNYILQLEKCMRTKWWHCSSVHTDAVPGSNQYLGIQFTLILATQWVSILFDHCWSVFILFDYCWCVFPSFLWKVPVELLDEIVSELQPFLHQCLVSCGALLQVGEEHLHTCTQEPQNFISHTHTNTRACTYCATQAHL